MPWEIWTVGHSNRDLNSFLSVLAGSSINLLADVRRFPGSRLLPHFHRDALETALAGAGIGYRHFGALGGRRTSRAPGSAPHRLARRGVQRLRRLHGHARVRRGPRRADRVRLGARAAVMCSEAVPWRCHRRLIADALIVRGWTVWDILGPAKVDRHALTQFARVEGGRLTYPAEPLFPGQEE